MSDDCGCVLGEAVRLLRDLSCRADNPVAARARVTEWRATHPGLRADLLIHQPPASDRADYDLLLGLPGGGAHTVALSWCLDRGQPWAISYADHWASNYLVTVNNTPTTIQEALLYLRSVEGNYPELMEAILEHHLLSDGVRENPPSVSPQELQEGADRFRQAHGLFTMEATQRWLDDVRLSLAQFEQLVMENVQRRKFKQGLVEERVRPYFEEHRTEFDTVRLFQAEVPECEAAERLAAGARERGDLRAAVEERLNAAECPVGLAGMLRVTVARQLFAWILEAEAGAVAGPVRQGRCWHLAQILGRQPALSLDGATREAVADAAYRAWLAERRERAVIRWHWM
ncbi:MAG: TIGR04500 family putative peptide maturation system protein [Gemmatimonadota bacterium]|nr:TIGR04500 family putative peptide maturation system protein [Gemmatimonadota bacterium]